MKTNLFNTIEEFKIAALDAATDADAAPISDARVRASFDTEVKAEESATRSLLFTISTASVDRMGDTIAVDGWKLEAYRKNPVVLWAHDSSMLPVAKAPNVWMEEGKLKATAEFTPPGMAKFNDTVFDMYALGFLSATSVGFVPHKYALTNDPKRGFGVDFLQQELLEFSCVPVPANSEALIEGRSAGIDIAPVLDWAQLQVARATDAADRVKALAESVLGGSSPDESLLVWASGIVEATGKAIVSRERIVAIERSAMQERLRKKRARDLDVIRFGRK